jgi:hypothetical protein
MLRPPLQLPSLRLRGSRSSSGDIKLWLGIDLSAYRNDQRPLEEWFDDASWSNVLIPTITDSAGAARLLEFAGLAFDEGAVPRSVRRSRNVELWTTRGTRARRRKSEPRRVHAVHKS